MLLKQLTDLNGVSGNEADVRRFLIDLLKEHVDECRVDRMGNLIVKKQGPGSAPHIAVTAHMDEVGLIVKGIDTSGLIRFAPIGGIDPRVLVSKVVAIGPNQIPGVIGAKAVHLQKPEERTKAHAGDQLYIDIGCTDQRDTEKYVSVGDFIAFVSPYTEFGRNRIKAKALDNRVGCYLLSQLLLKDSPVTLTGIFTVQEEVGLRGAKVASQQLDLDLAIILEGTTCSDVTDVEPHLQATSLDKGPAISLMDRTSLYQKKWVDTLVQVAKENQIPWQYRRTTFGGNDAGEFHLGKGGTPCVSMAVPCRYIHSPVSVLSQDDLANAEKLLFKYVEKLGEGGLF